jgi:hypothetical protein
MDAPASVVRGAETELEELRENDRLHVEDLGTIDGDVTLSLPMPGIARLRIT